METIFRAFLLSLLLTGGGYFWEIKKRGHEFNLKLEAIFSIVTSGAILIIVRSVVARLGQIIGTGQLIQEIMVAVCAIAAYGIAKFLGKALLKENFIKWMYYMSSLVLTINIVVFLILGYFTKEIYLISFIVSVLISLIVIAVKGNSIEISATKVWKARLKFSLPVSLFVGITFFVYLPSELYFGNPEYFLVHYSMFIWPLALECIAFILVYLLITLFCVTKEHYYLCNNICAVLGLMANIQHMLLNGRMYSMDGTEQQWVKGTITSNLLLWILIFAAILLISHFKKKNLRNVLKVVAYCGTAIEIIALVLLMVMTLPTIEFDDYELTVNHTFEIAPENNVFVFVLDSYDNQNIDQILATDEDFLKPLDGFTRYANSTGKYAFTNLGIPYLLTGIETEYEEREKSYAVYANEASNVLEEIASQGYTLGLYTEAEFISPKEYKLIENGEYTKRSLNVVSEIEIMSKAARYQAYPFLIKNYFYYSTDEISDLRVTDIELHNVYNDAPFAKRLLEDGIQVDSSRKGAYKFYHLHGTHTYYNMNEEFENEDTDFLTQARGSMKIVYEFIEQLKEAGVYEDSTIIITADHGQNFFDRPERAYELGMELFSSPIMFVKKAGDYGTELRVSYAPVSQDEVIPTVMQAITGESEKYGKTFDEIGEGEERERKFVFGRHDDIDFQMYTINGYVMDEDAWSEPVALTEE